MDVEVCLPPRLLCLAQRLMLAQCGSWCETLGLRDDMMTWMMPCGIRWHYHMKVYGLVVHLM